ncbi:MAG: allophanate hydrolase [Deltaproteobacteria bacterium HGW-Deltaproteobacteria-19]|jgi:KipI family sensor histidine kinase inhibitor|nr:MAG: allophanate hydrolase [Deltaproteobacteria bacterium HGW-Deltaproteobacteria-19]
MATTLPFDKPRLRHSGDMALLVEYGDAIDPAINEKVRAVTTLLKRNLPEGVLAVVPAYRSLSLLYDPLRTSPDRLSKVLDELEGHLREVEIPPPRVVEIPVCYGGEHGPDIHVVAEHNGLTPEEVIAIHSGTDYPIYMIGFTPGFCYLGGLDGRIATPRRETPRTLLPGGSVGIAEAQTGIYPVDSPGGWQIIGRTPLRLFAPEREMPFLYEAGERIRFVPIPEAEFDRIHQEEKS